MSFQHVNFRYAAAAAGVLSLLGCAVGPSDGRAVNRAAVSAHEANLIVHVRGAYPGVLTSEPAGLACEGSGTCSAAFPPGVTRIRITPRAANGGRGISFNALGYGNCTGFDPCEISLADGRVELHGNFAPLPRITEAAGGLLFALGYDDRLYQYPGENGRLPTFGDPNAHLFTLSLARNRMYGLGYDNRAIGLVDGRWQTVSDPRATFFDLVAAYTESPSVAQTLYGLGEDNRVYVSYDDGVSGGASAARWEVVGDPNAHFFALAAGPPIGARTGLHGIGYDHRIYGLGSNGFWSRIGQDGLRFQSVAVTLTGGLLAVDFDNRAYSFAHADTEWVPFGDPSARLLSVATGWRAGDVFGIALDGQAVQLIGGGWFATDNFLTPLK